MTTKFMKFATGNVNKVREAEAILGIGIIEQINLELEEIQEIDPERIIIKKAKEAFEKVGGPVLVDDTGLFINAWNGLPGALVKWFIRTVGTRGIINMLDKFKDRSAKAVTVVGFWDGKKLISGKGECKGKIVKKPRGDSGFGWDSIFMPKGAKLTFAQMSSEEKNLISMRSRALKNLKKRMKDFT